MKKILQVILLLAVVKMSAQEVPTFFPRKFLLEHFTSANCNQCPMGMRNIVEYLDKQTTPYVWVSHHAVYGTDEYTIPASNAIAMNFLGMNSVPSVVVNRAEHDGLLVLSAINDLYTLAVECDTVAEASVVIQHSYDSITRQLDITVSGQVANASVGQYLLSILIKENRLVGKQADQITSWKQANWSEYMHPRVVRDFLTATYGDTVLVNNQSYTYSTTYTVDTDWEADNCCIVAYLTPLTKKPVINVEQAALVIGTQGGEQYGPYGITEGKGPNTTINFDSINVAKIAENKLELMLLSSKTIQSRYMGICKQVGYLHVNSATDILQPGTYSIQESNALGTMTAGYRVDEEETLGGSRLVYALSEDLKNGIVTPVHMWRMSSGEMVLDESGNISLNFTTYNGTTVTATAVYDFTPATGFEEVFCRESSSVKKVMRNDLLVIEKDGMLFSILGYRLR